MARNGKLKVLNPPGWLPGYPQSLIEGRLPHPVRREFDTDLFLSLKISISSLQGYSAA